MVETIKVQGEEIKALKALSLLQKSLMPSSYTEITTNSGTPVGLPTAQTKPISSFSLLVCRPLACFALIKRSASDNSRTLSAGAAVMIT